MEALTRLVADSFARHGLDRPVDPRRLQWSRWSRCDSPHSLLVVPSKPGIFALAEEVMNLGVTNAPVATDAFVRPASEASGTVPQSGSRKPEDRRMLAVLQFSEDDDMAFTLDRMFTRINPMRARLASGRCFIRFAIIEDQDQRRSICTALNQWMLSSAEKATGLPAEFQPSLELTDCVGKDRVGRTLPSASSGQALSDSADSVSTPAQGMHTGQETGVVHSAPHPDSSASKNLHCPQSFPSGF